MPKRSKKKLISKAKTIPTEEILKTQDFDSENKVMLKITVRKGARIESVPKKKLEKLATKKRLYWKLEDEWLTLYGL